MFRDLLAVFLLSLTVGGCAADLSQRAQPVGEAVPAPQSSSLPERKTKAFDPQFDIGSIVQRERCISLRILNDTLIPGDTLEVIKVEHPQVVASAKIVEPVDCPESKASAVGEFVIDSDTNKEIVRYQIELASKPDDADFHLGIGILHTANIVTVKSGIAELEMPGKTPLRFRECTSNEGLHLTVWEGKPLVGKRVWQAYHHLLYDTVPTCKQKEVSGLYGEN